MATTKGLPTLLLSLFFILQLLSFTVSAQDCSKDGFCGTTSAHYGSGCQSTFDYKRPPTECSATRLRATGCCIEHGFCGTTEAHCGTGCQSICDFKRGCDKKNPCKDGTCCSKFGFCGFGPDCKSIKRILQSDYFILRMTSVQSVARTTVSRDAMPKPFVTPEATAPNMMSTRNVL